MSSHQLCRGYLTLPSNTVNVVSGGTVNGDVAGEYYEGSASGEATGNTVNISGGTVTGTVYGSRQDRRCAGPIRHPGQKMRQPGPVGGMTGIAGARMR
ncbi:MAG: hypothetical protein LBU46_03090, partial [Candidatus Accumulibacter sp.]|nr:hypothetical protein [Accumulibacter sp.]